jgi:hypothetical protein
LIKTIKDLLEKIEHEIIDYYTGEGIKKTSNNRLIIVTASHLISNAFTRVRTLDDLNYLMNMGKDFLAIAYQAAYARVKENERKNVE